MRAFLSSNGRRSAAKWAYSGALADVGGRKFGPLGASRVFGLPARYLVVKEREQMARILTLDEIEGEPVGGKASGLARLRDMGLRVPEAVVLVGAIRETPEGELDELVQKLVERFGADRVAVRSSALG